MATAVFQRGYLAIGLAVQHHGSSSSVRVIGVEETLLPQTATYQHSRTNTAHHSLAYVTPPHTHATPGG